MREESLAPRLHLGATFQIHRIEQPHWSISWFVTAALNASSTFVNAIGPYSIAVKEDAAHAERSCMLLPFLCTSLPQEISSAWQLD